MSSSCVRDSAEFVKICKRCSGLFRGEPEFSYILRPFGCHFHVISRYTTIVHAAGCLAVCEWSVRGHESQKIVLLVLGCAWSNSISALLTFAGADWRDAIGMNTSGRAVIVGMTNALAHDIMTVWSKPALSGVSTHTGLMHVLDRSILRLFLCTISVVGEAIAIWPIPRFLSTGSSAVKLSSSFAVHIDVPHAPKDLSDAVSRSKSRLQTDSFQRLVLGGASQDAAAVRTAHELDTLSLVLTPGSSIRTVSEETTSPINAKDESYTLSIPTQQAQAVLTANSTLGLLRGLTTFEQLWYDFNGTKYLLDAPINIIDEPAFVSFRRSALDPYWIVTRRVITAVQRFLLRYVQKFVGVRLCVFPISLSR